MLSVSHPDAPEIPHDPAELTRTLHAQTSLAATLETVLTLGTVHLGADGAGVVGKVTGQDSPVAATSETFRRLELAQLTSPGGGPAADILDSDPHALMRCLVSDTATVDPDAGWAEWCRQARLVGVRSVLTLRLHTPRCSFGALSFYSRTPHQFGPDQVDLASHFASQAGIALATAQAEEDLHAAIKGRHRMALALGMLMERFGLDEDRARELIQRRSDDIGSELRRTAQHLVATRHLPEGPARCC